MRGPVALIGANGQLGSDLRRTAPEGADLAALTRSDFDVRDLERATAVVESLHPSLIINTAAFHKVEACETDVEQAFDVNCVAVRNLARVADRLGARLVHFSTDYVFDGESREPYSESAAPNPVNAYGASKAAGEFFVRGLGSQHLLIRTSGLYGIAGSSGKGGNFVQTILRMGHERGQVSVVTDQALSPTYTEDLARKVWELVDAQAEGTYHVTNRGWCSWHEFAKAIFELSELNVTVNPVDTAASGSPIKRPRFSALSNARLEAEGFKPLRPWREALASYLKVGGGTSSETPVGMQHGVH